MGAWIRDTLGAFGSGGHGRNAGSSVPSWPGSRASSVHLPSPVSDRRPRRRNDRRRSRASTTRYAPPSRGRSSSSSPSTARAARSSGRTGAPSRGRRTRFTFFVSGVYLLDWAHSRLYRPPRHDPGRSDIGFAPSPEVVRGTLDDIAGAYREGNEIGTHFNGHFCAPYRGSVGEWNASDWQRELDEFDALLFHASANVGLHPPAQLPFGSTEIVGERTPCLQGNLPTLYRVLGHNGFRYDASRVELLGDWPKREHGLWSVPLLEIPFVGHTFRVVSMDYNFLANQLGPDDTVERETYLSLRRAFRTVYNGNRAPLSIGYHFETWHDWAYDRALVRFLTETCRLPEVRCASIRELVDWLDLRFPRLRLYPH
jgi:hypothetical protein